MLFAYGWQWVHGRDVTLNGLTLHLDRGWIVLHNSVVRIPDDIFYRDADVNVIFVKTLPDCPPPQAAAGTLTKLRIVMENKYSQPSLLTTLPIGDKFVSCFEFPTQASSRMTDTECISPSGQRAIGIHSTPPVRAEAIRMLRTVRETQTCKHVTFGIKR
jgi:hypothetical protein